MNEIMKILFDTKHWLAAILIMVVACKPSSNDTHVKRLYGSVPAVQSAVDMDLEEIKKRGTLRALMDNSSTSFFIYKGKLMGYEYDLLKLMAKDLGVKLELILTPSIDGAFRKLNNGEGDIIAHSLTITKDRKKKVAFVDSHYTTRQVLIQRKPRGWRKLKAHEYEKRMIRNPIALIGKEVHVRKSSAYVHRMHNLSEEIGGDIVVVEDSEDNDTESMIEKVLAGDIDYTVADEDMAKVNAAYYRDIDVKTPLSFPQQISWAVRKNAPDLLTYANRWFKEKKKASTYQVIYNKYFKNTRAALRRAKSDYSTLRGAKLSQYDDIIKENAEDLGWDWRLMAAQMYQESRFKPREESWAGAVGLMQLIPETGKRYGAKNLYDPKQNIKAATKFLKFLDRRWSRTIMDREERLKFVLASYNVGLGHVLDAQRLAEKYGGDPLIWNDNVEQYILKKSKPKYFKDPSVKWGYCRGRETVNYVSDILDTFEKYQQLVG